MLLRLVLCCCESRFDNVTWPEIRRKYGITGHRRLWISAKRYEDDVVFISKAFCHECVDKFIQMTYHPELAFDVEKKHERINGCSIENKFLDLIITMDFNNLNIDL